MKLSLIDLLSKPKHPILYSLNFNVFSIALLMPIPAGVVRILCLRHRSVRVSSAFTVWAPPLSWEQISLLRELPFCICLNAQHTCPFKGYLSGQTAGDIPTKPFHQTPKLTTQVQSGGEDTDAFSQFLLFMILHLKYCATKLEAAALACSSQQWNLEATGEQFLLTGFRIPICSKHVLHLL